MAKTKKSKQIVVYKPPKSKNKQPKKTKDDGALVAYRAALANPFGSQSMGARVPDMYAIPTATRHITRTITLATDSSGELDLIVIPAAFYHAFSPRGSIVGGTNVVLLDGTTVNAFGVFTSTSSLASHLANYRVVGYGVRVLGTSSLTSTSGKVIMATIPIQSYINTTDNVGGQVANSNNANATLANTLVAWGIPTASSKVNVGALPTLPNNIETSLVHLCEKPMTVTPKICSPTAFIFKQTTDNAIGYNLNNQTSLSNVQAGDASYKSFGGHESVVIALSGGPASTSVLEVEVTYHLEGAPFVSTASNAQIGGDSVTPVVNPTAFMKIIADVAKTPAFKTAVELGGNSFYPGLGNFVTKFL